MGSIRLEYRGGSFQFLPQEKALLDSVQIVAASILRTSSLIEDLRSTSTHLSAKNIALREVLSVIEEDRRNALSSFRRRLAAEILPLAERARDALLTEERRRSYLDLLIDEIGRHIAASGSDPAADHALSPREREIAVQVRNGRTSKEIAELLGIAEATVERHRHNIRKKFRIANQPVNLAGLLSNEDSAGRSPGGSAGRLDP
jgi:DNA-binding CsgD family transcriptional regulator